MTSRDAQTRPASAWLIPLSIFVLTFVAFVPALRAGFCALDDPAIFLVFDRLAPLTPERLGWMLSTNYLGHYQPLTWLSYSVDLALWGSGPTGLHLTNLLLHAGSAVLVYRLALRLLAPGATSPAITAPMDRCSAAAAAVFFSIHPLRVESVAWITERRDVLSVFLLLLATLAYLRHAEEAARPLTSAGRRWYLATLALLLLSLLAKAWGITFFAVALVLDVYPLRRLRGGPRSWLRRPDSTVLLEKIPMALLCLAFAVQAARAQRFLPEVTVSLSRWGIEARLAQAAYGVAFYIRKLLWPANLSILYELPARFEPSEARWLAGGALALALAVSVIALRRRFPGFAAAAACYIVVLSPVLGLHQSGIQLVADRYSYAATIPWALLAGAAVRRLLRAREPWRAITLFAVWALLAALLVATWRYTDLWRDNERLFAHAIEGGHDGPLLRDHYGTQLQLKGRHGDAIREFDQAVALQPDRGPTWLRRGHSLRDLRRYDEASDSYRRAAELMAEGWVADVARAEMEHEHLHRLAETRAALEAAIARMRSPRSPSSSGRPYILLAQVLDELRDAQGCRRALEAAAACPDTRQAAIEYLEQMGVAPPPMAPSPP
jgi:protein O-mannosyl-transferase